jgi:hypothetical protein
VRPRVLREPIAGPFVNIVVTVTGILLIFGRFFTAFHPGILWHGGFGISYYPISMALNILLTLMIVIRLMLHSRYFLSAVGAPAGTGGLYKTTITLLIESSALYTLVSLSSIALFGVASTSTSGYTYLPFVQMTPAAQVRASAVLRNV